MVKICECGMELTEDDLFCHSCGTEVQKIDEVAVLRDLVIQQREALRKQTETMDLNIALIVGTTRWLQFGVFFLLLLMVLFNVIVPFCITVQTRPILYYNTSDLALSAHCENLLVQFLDGRPIDHDEYAIKVEIQTSSNSSDRVKTETIYLWFSAIRDECDLFQVFPEKNDTIQTITYVGLYVYCYDPTDAFSYYITIIDGIVDNSLPLSIND